ncbi:MAG: hypothetical protein JKY37_18815 [Nannocystaceae bacterium]|nr:hypothetical protein [Nannocystaceae bacterium]
MSPPLSEFVERFVLPLLAGGPVAVGAPIAPSDRDAMAESPRELGLPTLGFSRLRRAQRLVPNPVLPEPDLEELTLWVGLHNTLVFDHPERRRVWARSTTWRRLEGATRTFLTLPSTTDTGEGLARHVSVGAFVELTRRDTVVPTAAGEVRFLGQTVPTRRFPWASVPQSGHREEVVPWLSAAHAPETQRLIEDALRASPLTCLLHPRRAPPGWSPLLASEFLRDRGFARSIVYSWARDPEWVAVGGAVTSALLPSLPLPPNHGGSGGRKGDGAGHEASVAGPPKGQQASEKPRVLALPGAVVPTSPAALSAVVGALIHLHFLKVAELEARLGALATGRDPGTLAFLALPLVLPQLASVTGTPLPGMPADGLNPESTPTGRRGFAASRTALSSGTVSRRWVEYLDHLEELVPRQTVDTLVAALVPRIVQTP